VSHWPIWADKLKSAHSSEQRMQSLAYSVTSRAFLVPFQVGSFRWAWSGLACSVLSDQAQAALLAVVALNMVGSASGWAAILTAQAVPRLLLIVVGGAVADRAHPQLILRLGNALQAVALVCVAVLDRLGVLAVPHLYAFAITYGALAAFTAPAADLLVPSLLPPELMRQGNALRSLAMNVGRFLGPPLATTLLAVAGAAVALLGVGGVCVAAALSFGRAPAGIRRPQSAEPFLAHAKAGLAVASSEPLVGVPILMLVIFNVGYSGATFVGLPTLAKLEFGLGPQGVGLLLGSLGAGALVGAITMALVRGIPRLGRFACFGIALVGLGLIGAGLAQALLTAAACLVVAGVGISCAVVALLTIVQTHTPPDVRGRVQALWSLAFTGLTPASYALGGLLGERFGSHGLLVLGGLGVLSAAAFGLASPAMRRLA
jgi:MFS family permease